MTQINIQGKIDDAKDVVNMVLAKRGGRPRTLSIEQISEIQRLAKTGVPAREIEKKLGIKHGQVSYWTKKMNETRETRETKESRES